VAVSLECSPNSFEIVVSDNGRGVDKKYTSGFGTTLIDTWCRTLGGTWNLSSPEEGGAVLTALIPTRDEARSTPDPTA